jgi:hypothetical protein
MKKERNLNKLIAHYDALQAERARRKAIEEPFNARIREIKDAPRVTKYDFWCTECGQDFVGLAWKQVSGVRQELPCAWYVGKCPKGHKAIRKITDKNTDHYYDLSRMVAKQRYDMQDAFLTPDDPRFRILYPKQYEELTKHYGPGQGQKKIKYHQRTYLFWRGYLRISL